jgi:hypothetical protein
MAKKKPEAEACKNCKFWVKTVEEEPSGDCRRRPPVILFHHNQENSGWPLTYPDDWCGEHQF